MIVSVHHAHSGTWAIDVFRQTLTLDEATSALDVELEHTVNTAVQRLNITRIVIAHRPETIASADRVLALGNQQVTEVAPSRRCTSPYVSTYDPTRLFLDAPPFIGW